MAVHVPIDMNVGDFIRIMFQPPNSKTRFGLTGIIKNRENIRYGIEFTHLGPAEAVELTRVVNSLKSSPSVASFYQVTLRSELYTRADSRAVAYSAFERKALPC